MQPLPTALPEPGGSLHPWGSEPTEAESPGQWWACAEGRGLSERLPKALGTRTGHQFSLL